MEQSKKNFWNTRFIAKSSHSRIVAGINQKHDRDGDMRIQAVFGPSVFNGRVDGRFIPLPSDADGIEDWADDMHDLIDTLVDRAKELVREHLEKGADGETEPSDHESKSKPKSKSVQSKDY